MQYNNYSINYQTWYEAYFKNRELAGENENVNTSMIWGSLWDETLKWLVESGTKTSTGNTITYSLVGSNSQSWGNYYYSTFNYIPAGAEEPEATATKTLGKSTIIPTGSTEYTKVNNIYDMAGNMAEWTLETNSTNGRVYRGSYYNDVSSASNLHANRRYFQRQQRSRY